jgi:transglutaminase-like putative cysteine protease
MSGDSGVVPKPAVAPADPARHGPAPRGDFWFRLLNHATLAMAGVCLVHGEAYFLPLLPFCLLLYLALLVAAFRAEGRWALSDRWANFWGVLIVVGIVLWVRYQPGGPGVLHDVEGWVLVVPYFGPFLMALLAVQLFRARGPRDFWYLQGMGLVQVALGCVLASSPLFGLLMAVYLTCALGCLALHYLAVPGAAGRPPSWRWLSGFVARTALVVGAAALAAFLVTPRTRGPAWDPLQRFGNRTPQANRWPPPGAPNQGANLNGTTPVELTGAEAFAFRATDVRGPKLDVPRDLRFRAFVLETYQDGVWPLDALGSGYRGMTKANPWDKDHLPDFGPDEYFIHFDVKPQVATDGHGLVLAEPVRMGHYGGHRLPVALTDFSRPHAQIFFEQPYSGTLLTVPNLEWSRYRYRQVLPSTGDPDRTPASLSLGGAVYISELTRQSLPRLETWTTALLRRLAAEPRGGISPDVLVPDPRWPERSFHIRPEHWEAVATALNRYLSLSGEYTYSLEQRRQNFHLDPVEDFLFNVKEGHCERYASALVLMLRTQGIPARMIKGYRGTEPLGGGAYVVRQNMAHAWSEVLVRHPPGEPGRPFDWLALDPTPGAEATRSPSPVSDWIKGKSVAGADMWRRLIVNYDADNRTAVLGVISPPSVLRVVAVSSLIYLAPPVLGLTLVTLFVSVRVRQGRRVVADGAPVAACYARMVRVLERRGRLRRAAAQTPRELAAVAGCALAARPATAGLADVPERVVDLFYRVRFGGQSPDGAELQRLGTLLDELASALVRSGPLRSADGG